MAEQSCVKARTAAQQGGVGGSCPGRQVFEEERRRGHLL